LASRKLIQNGLETIYRSASSEIAKEQNLPRTYEAADLISWGWPEKNFDLVVAQTYLHHILFLERVAEPSGSTMAGESIRGD